MKLYGALELHWSSGVRCFVLAIWEKGRGFDLASHQLTLAAVRQWARFGTDLWNSMSRFLQKNVLLNRALQLHSLCWRSDKREVGLHISQQLYRCKSTVGPVWVSCGGQQRTAVKVHAHFCTEEEMHITSPGACSTPGRLCWRCSITLPEPPTVPALFFYLSCCATLQQSQMPDRSWSR